MKTKLKKYFCNRILILSIKKINETKTNKNNKNNNTINSIESKKKVEKTSSIEKHLYKRQKINITIEGRV